MSKVLHSVRVWIAGRDGTETRLGACYCQAETIRPADGRNLSGIRNFGHDNDAIGSVRVPMFDQLAVDTGLLFLHSSFQFDIHKFADCRSCFGSILHHWQLTGDKGGICIFSLHSVLPWPTIQVRRSSDDAVLDFYADQYGNFGTLLDGSGDSLTGCLSSALGYVVVWYDQSGQGNHATQYIQSLQPVFDTINKRMDFTANGGTCYLNLPSGTVPQQISYTVTTKHNNINNGDGPWLSGGMSYVHLGSNGFRRMDSQYRNWWWDNDADADGYAPGNTVTFTYDGSARFAYVNGVLQSTVASSSWGGQPGYEYIAKTIYWDSLNGELYFLHIFASCLSDHHRAVVETGFLDYNCPGMYPELCSWILIHIILIHHQKALRHRVSGDCYIHVLNSNTATLSYGS